MSRIETGQCECCRKVQAEWECVNFKTYIMDLCDGCFQELRNIHKQHPARQRVNGLRSSSEEMSLELAVHAWLDSKQPKAERQPGEIFVPCAMPF